MDAARPATGELSSIIDRFLADHPDVPGASAAVVPADGPVVRAARGLADPVAGEPLTVDHAVRIASSTKPFVASTVLVLAHRGLLALDEPAVSFAPDDVVPLLRRYEHGATVTVRQLLQHTGGLDDHATQPDYLGTVSAEPGRRWTPLEQLERGLALPPRWAPGTAFAYSDTGYVLLGTLVAHRTGVPLAAAVRAAVHLDRLGMESTWWESVEPAPAGVRRAHQHLRGVDTYRWDPGFDLHGGGGLVATPLDVARWWLALFQGRVHDHLDEQLATPVPTAAPDGTAFGVGDAMGLGVIRSHVGDRLQWGHGGFWGTREHYVPSLRTALAVYVTDNVAAPAVAAALVAPIVEWLAGTASSTARADGSSSLRDGRRTVEEKTTN